MCELNLNERKNMSAINLTLLLLKVLFLRGKNEPFLHENALNLTHDFLYDNFNKKIWVNFLVKIVTQKLMCQI